MRVFIVFALAIGVGSVFAFATYNYVQKAPKGGPAVETVPVVVAAANLEIGAEIGRDDVRVIQWPAASAPAGAIGNADEVIGRGLIMPVVQNEVILPMKLASKEAGSGLPPVIPPGYRAVSVRVNEVIGVAGYVLPGTHVDVVVTLSPDQHSGRH
jgi:pilus assembly protein CpaB